MAYLIPAMFSLLIPAIYLVTAAHGRFRYAATLWLLWPVAVYCCVIIWELMTRAPVADPFSNAFLGFSLLSALLLLPWLLISALIIGLAIGLRRWFKRSEPLIKQDQVKVVVTPPELDNQLTDLDASTAEPEISDASMPTSPDGTISVAFQPIEWYNNLWLSPPRVTDLSTGKIVLSLWGHDWDVRVEYPAPRQVLLEGWRYNGGGVKVLLDLANQTYQILELRNVEGPFPSAPLSQVKQGLIDATLRSSVAAQALAGVPPQIASPTKKIGKKLVILTGTGAAIVLLAILANIATANNKPSVSIIKVPEGGFRPTSTN
jgi:hypothetical protein